jgi:hypothetical protein
VDGTTNATPTPLPNKTKIGQTVGVGGNSHTKGGVFVFTHSERLVFVVFYC